MPRHASLLYAELPFAGKSARGAHSEAMSEVRSRITPVSVVIPARDERDYIVAALVSVRQQRYPLPALEAIVVDNGSSDGTADIARAFGNGNEHMQTRVLEVPEAGVSAAKNRGAAVSTGDVVIFLDADSRLEPNLVRHVVERYDAGYRAGSIRIKADSTDLLERGFFALIEVGKVWFGVRAQMLYCDRALFLELGGFRPELRQGEDLEFLRRVAGRLRAYDERPVCHVRGAAILTSPRRLRAYPFRLGVPIMFARWALAFVGIGRTTPY